MIYQTVEQKLNDMTVKALSAYLTERKINGRSLAKTKEQKIQLILSQIEKVDVTVTVEPKPKKIKTANTAQLRVGDTVRIKPTTDKVEVNDFHSQPFYFEHEDVGTVIYVNSPSLRYRNGKPDTQHVIRFYKEGRELVVRVDHGDLEVCTLTTNLTQSEIDKLICDCKMCGRLYESAVLHPSHNPGINSIDCLNNVQGLIVAYDLRTRSKYVFHLSQMNRETAIYKN